MNYWAGYQGSGLVLKENEFNDFLSRYEKMNGDDISTFLEEEPIREYAFVKSDYAGKYMEHDSIPSEHVFYVTDVLKDDCDGMFFTPYMSNGKKNLCWIGEERNPNYEEYGMRADNVYVFWADKSMDGVNAFDEKPYASYQVFVDEFKSKVEKYLPDDFEWDRHPGLFNYAAYA